MGGGALLIMEERGILQKLERYTGAYAGALTAMMLSVGYTAVEVFKILIKFNFNDLLDDSWGISTDLYRVYNEYGFYKGEYLQEYVRKLIAAKTDIPNVTFQQLYDLTKKDLILVATNVSKDSTVYLSHYTTPNMPVDLGVSCNYPINIFDGDYPDDDFDGLFKATNSEKIDLKLKGADETRSQRIFTNP